MFSHPAFSPVKVLGLYLLLALFNPTWAGINESERAKTGADHRILVEDIQPLAEQGDANAQFFLGAMYRYGQNVPQDYAQAITWYSKAAAQGDVRAQYNLAVMYSEGQGVQQNITQTAKWYRMAAEQGHVPAQYNLGVLYGNGIGVPHDIIEAYKWFSVAAASGDADAIRNRDLTEKILTPTQLEEARKLTREWTEAHPSSR